MRHILRLLPVLTVLTVAGIAVSPADAQHFGVRAGFSADPDQLYLGIHAQTGPVFERFQFRPNAEVGFGDNLTLVGLNGEFTYPFQLENGTALYVGAGPAINILSFDVDTRIEPGLNFLLGFNFERNYFAEIKVGAFDSPDFKIGIGYTFPGE